MHKLNIARDVAGHPMLWLDGVKVEGTQSVALIEELGRPSKLTVTMLLEGIEHGVPVPTPVNRLADAWELMPDEQQDSLRANTKYATLAEALDRLTGLA
jgi:hypothetical protein